jgi:hypothetical protein
MVLEVPLAEGAVEVEAGGLYGVEVAFDVGERHLVLACSHGPDRPRRDLVDTGDRDEVGHGRGC